MKRVATKTIVSILSVLVLTTTSLLGVTWAQHLDPLPLNPSPVDECVPFNESPLSLRDIDGVTNSKPRRLTNLDGDAYPNDDELIANSDPTDSRSTPLDKDGDGFRGGVGGDDPCDYDDSVPARLILKNPMLTESDGDADRQLFRGESFTVQVGLLKPAAGGTELPVSGATVDVLAYQPGLDVPVRYAMSEVPAQPGVYQRQVNIGFGDRADDEAPWIIDIEATHEGNKTSLDRGNPPVTPAQTWELQVDPVSFHLGLTTWHCTGSVCDEVTGSKFFYDGQNITVRAKPTTDPKFFAPAGAPLPQATIDYRANFYLPELGIPVPVLTGDPCGEPTGAAPVIGPCPKAMNPVFVTDSESVFYPFYWEYKILAKDVFAIADQHDALFRIFEPQTDVAINVHAEDEALVDPNFQDNSTSRSILFQNLFAVAITSPLDGASAVRGDTLELEVEWTNKRNPGQAPPEGLQVSVDLYPENDGDDPTAFATVPLVQQGTTRTFKGEYEIDPADPIVAGAAWELKASATGTGGVEVQSSNNAVFVNVRPLTVPGTLTIETEPDPIPLPLDQTLLTGSFEIDATYRLQDGLEAGKDYCNSTPVEVPGPIGNTCADAPAAPPGRVYVVIRDANGVPIPVLNDNQDNPAGDPPTVTTRDCDVCTAQELKWNAGTGQFEGPIKVPLLQALVHAGDWEVTVIHEDRASLPNGRSETVTVKTVREQTATPIEIVVESPSVTITELVGTNSPDGLGLTGEPAVDFDPIFSDDGNPVNDDGTTRHRFIIVRGEVTEQRIVFYRDSNDDGFPDEEIPLPIPSRPVVGVGVQFNGTQFAGEAFFRPAPVAAGKWEAVFDTTLYCEGVLFTSGAVLPNAVCNDVTAGMGLKDLRDVEVKAFAYSAPIVSEGFPTPSDPTDNVFVPDPTGEIGNVRIDALGQGDEADVFPLAPSQVEAPQFYVANDPSGTFSKLDVESFEFEYLGPSEFARLGVLQPTNRDLTDLREVYAGESGRGGAVLWTTGDPAAPTMELLVDWANPHDQDVAVADMDLMLASVRWRNCDGSSGNEWCIQEYYNATGVVDAFPPYSDELVEGEERISVPPQYNDLDAYDGDTFAGTFQGPFFNSTGGGERFWVRLNITNELGFVKELRTPNMCCNVAGETPKATTPAEGAFPARTFAFPPDSGFTGRQLTFVDRFMNITFIDSLIQHRPKPATPGGAIPPSDALVERSDPDPFRFTWTEGTASMYSYTHNSGNSAQTHAITGHVFDDTLRVKYEGRVDSFEEGASTGDYVLDALPQFRIARHNVGHALTVIASPVTRSQAAFAHQADGVVDDRAWDELWDIKDWVEQIHYTHGSSRQGLSEDVIQVDIGTKTFFGLPYQRTFYFRVDQSSYPVADTFTRIEYNDHDGPEGNDAVAEPASPIVHPIRQLTDQKLECRGACNLVFSVTDLDGYGPDAAGDKLDVLSFSDTHEDALDNEVQWAAGEYAWQESEEEIAVTSPTTVDAAVLKETLAPYANLTLNLTGEPAVDMLIPDGEHIIAVRGVDGADTKTGDAVVPDGFIVQPNILPFTCPAVLVDVKCGQDPAHYPVFRFVYVVHNDDDSDTHSTSLEHKIRDQMRGLAFAGLHRDFPYRGVTSLPGNQLPLATGTLDVTVGPDAGETGTKTATIVANKSTPCDWDGDGIPNDLFCLGEGIDLEELFNTHPLLPDSPSADWNQNGIPNHIDPLQGHRVDCGDPATRDGQTGDRDFDGYCDAEEEDVSDPDDPRSTPLFPSGFPLNADQRDFINGILADHTSCTLEDVEGGNVECLLNVDPEEQIRQVVCPQMPEGTPLELCVQEALGPVGEALEPVFAALTNISEMARDTVCSFDESGGENTQECVENIVAAGGAGIVAEGVRQACGVLEQDPGEADPTALAVCAQSAVVPLIVAQLCEAGEEPGDPKDPTTAVACVSTAVAALIATVIAEALRISEEAGAAAEQAVGTAVGVVVGGVGTAHETVCELTQGNPSAPPPVGTADCALALANFLFDLDGDGYPNDQEALSLTNPLHANSNPRNPGAGFLLDWDGDGYTNEQELLGNGDPFNACSSPRNGAGMQVPPSPPGGGC